MSFERDIPIQNNILKQRRMKVKRLITGLIILMAIFFATAFLAVNIHNLGSFLAGASDNVAASGSSKNSPTQNNSGSSGNQVTPTTDQSSVKLTDTTKLKKSLEKYIKKFSGKYGIYYMNLSDGASFGINSSTQFFAASTVKVPINLYLFKRIEAGAINPENTMTYLKQDYEAGTGIIQYKKYGAKYKIRELSRLSIEYSDNVATNMLIRLLGRQNYKNFMKKMGGSVVVDSNISCPKDMAIYMKKVYDFSKSNKKLGGELMGYFENTEFADRLPKLLPKSVKIAHKIGNYWDSDWGIVRHDVGIIYTKKPFILAVMSKNVKTYSEADNVIAQIAKKVYDFQIKLK